MTALIFISWFIGLATAYFYSFSLTTLVVVLICTFFNAVVFLGDCPKPSKTCLKVERIGLKRF